MSKAIRFGRDAAVAFGLFFVGALWFTFVWPDIGASIGALMVIGAAIDTAKINVSPFADLGVFATYRAYFPRPLQKSNFRATGTICIRFGLIAFLIPVGLFIPVWIAVKEAEKMQGYTIIVTLLGIISVLFQLRGGLLLFRSAR